MRLKSHFETVLSELRSADVSHLNPRQRERRRTAIGWLESYADQGVYPHNHEVEAYSPIFVDQHGTPCAVGYLLLRSGEQNLVEDVVREANLARVPDLAADIRLATWLVEYGLSVDEAARIQPSYPGGPHLILVESESRYTVATVGAGALTAAAVIFSELTAVQSGGVEWGGVFNVLTLVGHGALLFVEADAPGDVPNWEVAVNVGGVVVSGVAAYRRFRRQKNAPLRGETAAWQPHLTVSTNNLNVGMTLRF